MPAQGSSRRAQCTQRLWNLTPKWLQRILLHSLKEPPNGGVAGALVIAATFVNYAFVIGLESVYGLFVSAMLEDETSHFTRSGLSWVGSTALFLELALGVVVGHMVDKLGTRPTIILGTAILSTGLVLGSAATTEAQFAFAYSLLAGTGMALAYGAASIGISQYFTTRSAFANGTAGVGIGAGTMLLSQLMEYSIARVGWRGCMNLLAALLAVFVSISALAFVPIESLQAQDGEGKQGSSTTTAATAHDTANPHAGPASSSSSSSSTDTRPGRVGGEVHEVDLDTSRDDAGVTASGKALHAVETRVASSSSFTSRGVGSPLTALKVLQTRAGTEGNAAEHGVGGGAEHGVGGGAGEVAEAQSPAHLPRTISHVPSSPSPLRMNIAPNMSSLALNEMDRSGSGSGARSSQASVSGTGSAGKNTPQLMAVQPSGRPPPHLRLQRVRAGTHASPWGGPMSPATTPDGGANTVGSPTPMALAARAKASPALASFRGAPGSALLTGITGTLPDMAHLEASAGAGAVGSESVVQGQVHQDDTLTDLPFQVQVEDDDHDDDAHTPLSPAPGPRKSSSIRRVPSGAGEGKRSGGSGAGAGAGAGKDKGVTLAVHEPVAITSHGSPAGGTSLAPAAWVHAGHPTSPPLHAQSKGHSSMGGSSNPFSTPLFGAHLPTGRKGGAGWRGSTNTPPISPWLLPGGQGSATSVVHQASLRHSALGALVRALEGEQAHGHGSGHGGAHGEKGAHRSPHSTHSTPARGMVHTSSYAGRAQLVDVHEEDEGQEHGHGHGQGTTAASGAGVQEMGIGSGLDSQSPTDAVSPASASRPKVGAWGRLLDAVRLLPRLPDGSIHTTSPAARVWLDARFWAIALAMALIISSMTVPETHLAPFVAQDMGLGQAEASRLFTVMGAAGIVGRLAFGFLTLYYEVDLQFLLQGCGVATGLAMAGLAVFGDSPGYLTLFSIVFGGIGGAAYGFVPPILAQFFGLQGLPAALGGTYTVRAPTVLLFSPIAGWVRDATGTYKGVFFVTGVLCVVSALPVGILHCGCKRHRLHAAVQEAAKVEGKEGSANSGSGGQEVSKGGSMHVVGASEEPAGPPLRHASV